MWISNDLTLYIVKIILSPLLYSVQLSSINGYVYGVYVQTTYSTSLIIWSYTTNDCSFIISY